MRDIEDKEVAGTVDTDQQDLDVTKRELVRRLATAAYVAPATLALMTVKADAQPGAS